MGIYKFQGENIWLSNFWYTWIKFEGMDYPSVEHAYQASKTTEIELRKKIRLATTSSEAKRLGKKVKLRPGWGEMKLEIMNRLVRQKFQDKELGVKLMGVEGPLVEGNHWGDTYWGVCKGVGENHLGKILMSIREELRNASVTA